MEFVVSILAKLQAEPTTAMGTIVSDTYYATLYKFHGFLVSTTFTVGGWRDSGDGRTGACRLWYE
jgi:hypothetical protein